MSAPWLASHAWVFQGNPYKGGDPTAGSPTVTLLRLSPHHGFHLRRLPCGSGDFGCPPLWWLDGRCVQGSGTHSPRHADPRLLAIPASCGRVAARNPNWGAVFAISSTLRPGDALSAPLKYVCSPRHKGH